MSIDKAKWIEGYAVESHEDRFMSIVEDGSCLDLLVEMALESVSLQAEIEQVRAIARAAAETEREACRNACHFVADQHLSTELRNVALQCEASVYAREVDALRSRSAAGGGK